MLVGDIAEFIARVLSKIFRNRPNCAYAIFAFLIIFVLGFMIFAAQDTDDLVFPILGLAFVLVVVLGYAFQAIRKHRSKDYQVPDQGPIDQVRLSDHQIIMPDPEEKMNVSPRIEGQVAQNSGMKKGNFRQILIISVIFFALGYLVAYFVDPTILAKLLTQIIPNWTVSQAIADLSSIRIVLLQLGCGFPCAFFAFMPILIVLYILIIRFTKPNLKILKITHAILSFIGGILIFGPMQVLLLFGGAI